MTLCMDATKCSQEDFIQSMRNAQNDDIANYAGLFKNDLAQSAGGELQPALPSEFLSFGL